MYLIASLSMNVIRHALGEIWLDQTKDNPHFLLVKLSEDTLLSGK